MILVKRGRKQHYNGNDVYYDFRERDDGYTILDDQGLIAGTIYFESGYYEGVQVIYKSMRGVWLRLYNWYMGR